MKRLYYLASVFVILVALVLHLFGREQTLKAQRLKAKRLETIEHTIQSSDNTKERFLFRMGQALTEIGSAFTAFSVIFLGVSLWRKESGWLLMPILFLFSDLMILMMV